MPKGYRQSWLKHPDIELLKSLYRDQRPLESLTIKDHALIKCITCERIQSKRIKNWLDGQRHGYECRKGRNVEKGAESKRCVICNEEKPLSEFRATLSVSTSNTLYHSRCYACIALDARQRLSKAKQEDPTRAWLMAAYVRLAGRARAQNLPFTLTKPELFSLWTGFCGYCKQVLRVTVENKHFEWDSPSIDKLIPELGYIQKNCIVACMQCNTIKGSWLPQELRLVAEKVEAEAAARGLAELLQRKAGDRQPSLPDDQSDVKLPARSDDPVAST